MMTQSMGPKEKELVKVLKEHADRYGEVKGDPTVVKEWIGNHAADWDIHEMIVSLKKRGYLPSNAYIEGLGGFTMTFPL